MVAPIGLMLPWSSSSRRRMVSRIRSKPPSSRRDSNCSWRLNTRTGRGIRRASREALGCSPTMKNGVPATLKAKCGSFGSADTSGAHGCSSTSCRRWRRAHSISSKCFSSRTSGPRKPATKETNPASGSTVAAYSRSCSSSARAVSGASRSSCSTTVARSRLNTERAPRHGYSGPRIRSDKSSPNSSADATTALRTAQTSCWRTPAGL